MSPMLKGPAGPEAGCCCLREIVGGWLVSASWWLAGGKLLLHVAGGIGKLKPAAVVKAPVAGCGWQES